MRLARWTGGALAALTLGTAAVAGAGPAAAEGPFGTTLQAYDKHGGVHGTVHVTKEWHKRGNAYDVTWSADHLKDKKGDGGHVVLWAVTVDASGRGGRFPLGQAKFGESVDLGTHTLVARSFHFQLCAYKGKRNIGCKND